ncbi:MAG: hypothetical protein HZB53_15525 [Chloroflexi bacterium]|nr:hypothetical protein [Chloroflexota bacterium]
MTNRTATPADAPLIDIPRHPLWMMAYDGAWSLWDRQAERIGTYGFHACAFVLYARYSRDRPRAAGVLDTLLATEHTSPLLPWAEWLFYQHSGDRDRLARVYPRLAAKHARLSEQLRQPSGLFGNWAPDATSPRECDEAVDTSTQMTLAAGCLSAIARAVGQDSAAEAHAAEQQTLAGLINRLCWDGETGFYLDRRADGSRSSIKTTAGLWPLIARVPDAEQARRIAAHLSDPDEFWRVHAFPCLSADHPRYAERGASGRGSVWPLDNYVILRGLERYGLSDLAIRAADNHVTTISHVFKETRSHWENYMPDYIEPGSIAQPDFVPTAGIGSVATLIETVLGLEVDAPARTLHWTPRFREAHTIERLRIADAEVNLAVSPAGDAFEATLSVSAPLTLALRLPDGTRSVGVDREYRFRY